MALLDREEFAALCQTSKAIITTNISRKKIIEDKVDNTIDTTDPINKEFFKKYIEKAKKERAKVKAVEKEHVSYDEIVEKVSERVSEKNTSRRKKKLKDESSETIGWDARKKRADALLQERKAEREHLNLQKLAGKLIPIDLVFNILKIHNQEIFATFQNDAENLASIYCDILAGGDRKRLSEITQKLAEKIENVISRAKDVSMSSIEQAVDEYKETRNRGEVK